jgi:hypothetical protein
MHPYPYGSPYRFNKMKRWKVPKPGSRWVRWDGKTVTKTFKRW